MRISTRALSIVGVTKYSKYRALSIVGVTKYSKYRALSIVSVTQMNTSAFNSAGASAVNRVGRASRAERHSLEGVHPREERMCQAGGM